MSQTSSTVASSGSQAVRVRFAPSPTGFLHIGGVRTALFNWLYAKKHGGQFLLRIEDTDLERSEERFTTDILSSLQWLGLQWDEELLFQSRRLDFYRAKAEALVAAGHAYRCTCSEEQIEAMRTAAMAKGLKPMYDRSCRDQNLKPPAGQPFVIRLKMPLQGKIAFEDLIHGSIEFDVVDLDDFVLIRSNGAPTYNLSVVIDDAETRMTHIIRGDDHINNTPKQVQLYRYLGYAIPLFAHLPMILGPDKKKLSKRNGVVSANVYRGDGYLPEALLNFLVRLGWSHGDQELISVAEMIQYFDFDHAQKSSAVFNVEKLQWTNGHYIRHASAERLTQILLKDFAGFFMGDLAQKRLKSTEGQVLLQALAQKCKDLKELAEQLAFFCADFDPAQAAPLDTSGLKWKKDPGLKPVIQNAVRLFLEETGKRFPQVLEKATVASPWGVQHTLGATGASHTDVEQLFKQIAQQSGAKLGDLMQPVRLVLSGRSNGVGVFEILPHFPWDWVLQRLRRVSELD